MKDGLRSAAAIFAARSRDTFEYQILNPAYMSGRINIDEDFSRIINPK